MNSLYRIICVFFLLSLISSAIRTELSLSNLLPKKTCQEVMRKEFRLPSDGTLSLENLRGSITIKPEWQQDTVVVSLRKSSTAPDQLKKVRFVSEQPTSSLLTLRTIYDGQDKVPAVCDYELIVPRNSTLKLSTREGDINVSNVTGSVHATTHLGSITVNQVKMVEATVKTEGAVTVQHAEGDVRVSTQKGLITIVDPRKDITALAMKGSINVQCNERPVYGQMWLKTGSGNIDVALPTTTNAELQAKASKGKIMCDHVVTINPITTKLDAQAWNKFKQEVSGTLGTKADNKVCLYTKKGNIKITEAQKLHRVHEMNMLS